MNDSRKIRYGVVGLGYIAQVAVLPAFKHAKENSELTALFSGDAEKRDRLGRKYQVPAFSYEDYYKDLGGMDLDAVYICSPNFQHCTDTVAAARHGLHVLCEKPMAVTLEECDDMIEACDNARVKLMIAYRLHFEEANLRAVEMIKTKKVGEPRLFNSVFSMLVAKDNIRLKPGGGPLLDLGIYCINAARYLFQEEPLEAFGFFSSGSRSSRKFNLVEEAVSGLLRFSNEKLASFTCSFGAADNSFYEVVGTKGTICLDPAYEYAEGLSLHSTIGSRNTEHSFKKQDQFAPELLYFSDCILQQKEPEADGIEGYNDVCIIEALRRSARDQQAVQLSLQKKSYPDLRLKKQRPPVKKPRLINVQQPHLEVKSSETQKAS